MLAQTMLLLVLLGGAIIGTIVACAALIALVLSFVWTDEHEAVRSVIPAAPRFPSGA